MKTYINFYSKESMFLISFSKNSEFEILHRTNGPALIYSNGEKEYRENDKLHRINSPAVIYPDGMEEYWEYGVRIK